MTAADATELRVRGGRGGTVAMLTDLASAAALLRAVADHLDQAYAICLGVRAEVTDGERWSPATASQVYTGLHRALSGPDGLLAAIDRIRAKAALVRRVRALYEQAEWAALDRLYVASRTAGLSAAQMAKVNPGGVAAGVGAAVVAGGSRQVMSWLTGSPGPMDLDPRIMEGFLDGAGAAVTRLPRGSSVPVLSAGLVGLADAVGHRSPSEVVVSPRGRAWVTSAPEGTADVVRRLGTTYRNPATVRVEQIDHADGSRSWVVLVPGTQDGGFSGDNAFDNDSNLRLMAGLPADSARLVLDAMEQAGIGADEPVLLAGHSQGGMVAMAIAEHAAGTGAYTVAAVATLGSPVAPRQSLPGHTTALHVEHDEDVVPALDGAPNPDTPQRITVRRALGTSSDPADREASRSVVAAHDIDVYGRTAALVDSSDDPSLEVWTHRVGTVLGDGTATSTVREFTGVRQPKAGAAPTGEPRAAPAPVLPGATAGPAGRSPAQN